MGNFCHFRAKKMGQGCENFQSFTKGVLGVEFEGENNCR